MTSPGQSDLRRPSPKGGGRARDIVSRAVFPQKTLGEPGGSGKFEQGGFTSRRRKGPKTLFPGASPGNSFGVPQPRKLAAMQYRVPAISPFTRLTTTGNSFWLVCKNRNAVKVPWFSRDNSPHYRFSLVFP